MGRAPCCDKANVKKGPWSPEEDAKLKAYIEQNGTGGNWIALPQKAGLRRCGKSCRLRWLNYLRPDIRHGGFTERRRQHYLQSLRHHWKQVLWSIIAAQLPGRTDNDIKNYWNTRLKKKLLGRRKDHHQTRRIKEEESVKNSSSATSNMFFPPEDISVPPSTNMNAIRLMMQMAKKNEASAGLSLQQQALEMDPNTMYPGMFSAPLLNNGFSGQDLGVLGLSGPCPEGTMEEFGPFEESGGMKKLLFWPGTEIDPTQIAHFNSQLMNFAHQIKVEDESNSQIMHAAQNNPTPNSNPVTGLAHREYSCCSSSSDVPSPWINDEQSGLTTEIPVTENLYWNTAAVPESENHVQNKFSSSSSFKSENTDYLHLPPVSSSAGFSDFSSSQTDCLDYAYLMPSATDAGHFPGILHNGSIIY